MILRKEVGVQKKVGDVQHSLADITKVILRKEVGVQKKEQAAILPKSME